ncbi:MAG: hypothetical protein LBV33_04700 [Lachnospiraceae bacterium]|jgi:hypothetical protein|nr:hypothetical protein [Lachnospiraceae bacterium]
MELNNPSATICAVCLLLQREPAEAFISDPTPANTEDYPTVISESEETVVELNPPADEAVVTPPVEPVMQGEVSDPNKMVGDM